ncbi:non-ribosomal peptide synthetase/MFS transporter [Micromonospora ureilytica]|uniref:Amino acid adenylation domain-containing protein n=1 Tax=Micromonospora ureilytica TaxID=709868 RepID=A0ABS0JBU8_9ACTN|nr:non-ribosomal peptide synthetase/MFS transporter [Micromonospora ureilytica]MBG6064533.1 amino acid adenylation domain-containing protein [Micromonospora ureilytica]
MSQAIGIRTSPVGEGPLWRAIVARAHRRPAATAVVDGAGDLTYAELVARVEERVAELTVAGVSDGDLVGLRMPRSRDAIVAMLAVLRVGAGYVPIDPAYPAERQELILADARPRAVISPDGVAATDTPVGAEAHAAAGTGAAYVVYTSGSTGRPKGVVVPTSALAAFCAAARQRYELTAADRVLQFASLSFDASVEEIFPALTCGAAVVLRDDDMISRPDLFLDGCAGLGITVLDLPTAYWHDLVAALDRGEATLPATIRLAIIGGEAARPDAVRRWQRAAGPGVRLLNTYGPTETTVVATVADLTDWAGDAVPIGHPLPGLTCRVLAADGAEAPDGEAGELAIGGAQVATGYLRRPDLTTERFRPGPNGREYRTGDRVRRAADGSLEFLGRLDEQMKIRGFRVEPGEIEAALRTAPGIEDAVVLLGERGGQARLTGHVVADRGIDLIAVRAALAEVLPAYLVPAALVRHDRLPITVQGKVDRRALAAVVPDGPVVDTDLTPAQRAVARIWTAVLGIPQVRQNDDFLALGGDSLDAIRMISALRHEHGVQLTLSRLYAAPTLAEVANLVTSVGTGGATETVAVAEGVPVALSSLQRDFWIAEQVCAALPAHTLGIRYRFAERVDPAALARALTALARRHPLLRARFPDDGAEPRMVIGSDALLELAQGEPVKAKFDLAAGPLARAYLGADGTELVLLVHHLVFDGWSATVVGEELAALYRAARTGAEPDLAPAVALPDLAARNTAARSDADLREYWRQRFVDADLDLELPADRPRPVARSFAAARLTRHVDPMLLERLRTYGRGERASLFMVVLAGLQTVLARYTGRTDVTVLTPVAGRTGPGEAALVGPLLNILPMRGDVTGAPTFAQLVARVRDAVLADLDHQTLALPDLVDALARPGSGNRNRVSPVMLTVHNTPAPNDTAIRYAGELPPAATMVDLAVGLDFPTDGPLLTIDYATELFDEPRMAALADHLLTLLAAAASDPDTDVLRLPLLTAEERHRILRDWNDVAAPVPDATTVHELFERHAAATPDAPALTFRGDTMSYGDVNMRANRIARRLRAAGVQPGDRVAICLDRGLDLFVAMWGVLKAGAAYVPLDPAYPRERLDYMLADSGATVSIDAAYLRDPLPGDGSDLPPAAAADDPAYVIYTSGSTGMAKGVVVTHRNLVHAADMWQRAYDLRPEWTYQQAASFSFDMFVGETLRAHTTGGRLVVVPRETLLDPADLYELMRTERVECTELVPAVLRGLLAHADRTGAGLSWLRMLIGGGEKWHVHEYELARRLVGPHGRVVNAYGVTEVTVDNVWFDGSAAHLPSEAPLPIGRPFPRNRVYVLDAHGEPVPAGVVGELYLGGAGVAPGYHQRPELTAERFIDDPYAPEAGARMYRSGDAARFHADGTVDFLGRLDDQVKVNGYRIELGEVEAALGALPGISSCAVAVHTPTSGIARLIGYVVTATGEEADEAVLRDALGRALPVHMVPARVLTLSALPLTPNGKLDRRRLPAPPQTAATLAGPAPETPREKAIAEAWSAVLGVADIGLDDSFFALGGDSFAALKVVRQITPAPTLLDLYQQPTVRRLAALLDSRVENPPAERRMLHRLTPHDADLAAGGVTVVGVPYSGGSAVAYQPLADALPSTWALLAVELPGHDYARPDEPLLPSAEVAERVLAELREVSGPVLLYGHCLGVAVTMQIARRAEEAGIELAGVALGAGFPTARLPGRVFDWFYRFVPTDALTSDREYLAYLRGRGGFTDVDDPQQQAFVLRNVRHDARDAEEFFTTAYGGQTARLKAPVLAVVGSRDRVTEHYQERFHEWEHFAEGGVRLAVLPKAGHFFVKSHAQPLAAELVAFAGGATTEPLPQDQQAGPAPSLARFATVAAGQFLSMIGSGLSALVLSIWVFQRTGSLTDFAVVNAIGLLPGILVGPIAGAVADRWDRRRVMLASDTVAGLSMVTLAVAVFAGGGLQLWQIYLAVSVTSMAGAFQRPAYLAAVAQLVPKRFLGHANGISQLGVSVGTVFAPLLGAGLIATVGVPGVLLIDTATFIAGVLSLLLVRFPNLMFHRREEAFRTEIANGWRYIIRRPGLRAALRFFIVDHAFYTLGFAVITPMLLIEQSPAVLGLALGAGGVGGLAGSVVMGVWGGTVRRAHGLILFMGLASIAMTVVGLGASPVWVIVGMFLLTFGESLAEGHWIAVVQTKVGFELQGRVLSIFISLMMLTMPIGYLVVGPLAERYVQPLLEPGGPLAGTVGEVLGTGPGRGLALLVTVSGLLQLAWAVRGWLDRRLRLLEDDLPDALPPAEIGSRDDLQRAADAALSTPR